jgi:hypothetical protein
MTAPAALRNRQTKAWAMARVLATFPNVGDPDLDSVDGAIREQVARVAGHRSGRPVSAWTWRLSLTHARRLAGVR